MEICNNIKTGKAFVHLEPQDDNHALMITPQGEIKELDYDLFTEPIEVEDGNALAESDINKAQYKIYVQYNQN
jgi:hypothetical protein